MANKILFIVVFCMALIFLANGAESQEEKRALKCYCNGIKEPPYGDHWVFRHWCPSGYGYTSNCINGLNVCCFPRSG
uniref:mRNA n=1 Tax=Oulactis sp. TaxID=2093647 RepID=A0A4D8XXM0_OULSP|nr:mRNA [Oulactis sp. MM-2018]